MGFGVASGTGGGFALGYRPLCSSILKFSSCFLSNHGSGLILRHCDVCSADWGFGVNRGQDRPCAESALDIPSSSSHPINRGYRSCNPCRLRWRRLPSGSRFAVEGTTLRISHLSCAVYSLRHEAGSGMLVPQLCSPSGASSKIGAESQEMVMVYCV